MPASLDHAAFLMQKFPGLQMSPMQQARVQILVGRRKLSAGRLLFAQGQRTRAFYAVMQGELEVNISAPEGSHSVLEHILPPKIFGLAAFVSGLPSTYEVRACTPAMLLVFDLAAYTYLMDEVPGFARALMGEFALRYDGTLRQLAASRHDPASRRFKAALRQLAQERQGLVATQASEPGWTHFRATQQELAALANLSRQTTQQLVSDAKTQGWLRQRYGQFWLSDDAWR